MILGAHVLLHSTDPEADRAFFRDVLQFPSVDAGHGWLIFALPPAELAIHPKDGDPPQAGEAQRMLDGVLYLMCDDLPGAIRTLESKGVGSSGITEARWGKTTTVRLPSGGEIGLYQPLHPLAIGLR